MGGMFGAELIRGARERDPGVGRGRGRSMMAIGFSGRNGMTWGSLCYHDSRGARRKC